MGGSSRAHMRDPIVDTELIPRRARKQGLDEIGWGVGWWTWGQAGLPDVGYKRG